MARSLDRGSRSGRGRGRGRELSYSDTAIATAGFTQSLTRLGRYFHVLSALMHAPLKSPDDTAVRKRVQSYRTPSHRPITRIVIDATGLKVFAAGEGTTRQYDREKCQIWHQ